MRAGILLATFRDVPGMFDSVDAGSVKIEETPANIWWGAAGAPSFWHKSRMTGITHSGTSNGAGSRRGTRFRRFACLVGVALDSVFGFENELLGVRSALFETGARVYRLVPAGSVLSRNL